VEPVVAEENVTLQPPAAARSLKAAVVTALILLGLIGLCYALGPTAFFFLALTVVLIALWEFLDALVQSGRKPCVPVGVAGGAGLMTVAFLERPALLPVVVAGTVYALLLWALRPGRGATPASDAALALLGVVWVGGAGAAAVAMLKLPAGGLELLVGFVLITAVDDIAAYFAGTSFGSHKMAPSISPAKSWEGFAGGLAGALAGGRADDARGRGGRRDLWAARAGRRPRRVACKT
jgi:phosphatidate cytidylyltransferase